MNIFLVGFMGSGKTTVGKKLAARLGWMFVDMDAEIERLEKRSIDRIFKEDGESYFRQLETDWLAGFNDDRSVVATGGGTPCFGNNLDIMKNKGVTVYLQAATAQIASRLLQSKGARPLIDHLKPDPEALAVFVEEKLAMRLPFYRQCDICMDAADLNASRLDELIVRLNAEIIRRGDPDPGHIGV